MAFDKPVIDDDDGSGEVGTEFDAAFFEDYGDRIDAAIDGADAGVRSVAKGGTGAATLTGILKGNGTSQVTAITIPGNTTTFLRGDGSFATPGLEGTWTPVIGGTGGTSGQTYVTQLGRYQKIGRRVNLQAYVRLSAKGTITSSVQISGLPFASANVASLFASAVFPYFVGMATNWITLGGYTVPNTSTIRLMGSQAAATGITEPLTTTDISNSTEFMISMSYDADS